MGKQRDDLEDLKRRLALLDRLDEPAVSCCDGVFLVSPGRVRDPRPLVTACQVGRPPSGVVHTGLAAKSAPVHVGPEILAAAHRDLRAIEGSPPLRALAREARLTRRYGEIDDAWIERKRQRLRVAMAAVRGAAEPVETGEDAWFARVLELIGAVHGEGAVSAVQEALGSIDQRARGRRAEARRALHAVLAALSGERGAGAASITRAVAELGATARLPGRARLRRVVTILEALLDARGVPEADHRPPGAPPPPAPPDPAADLIEQVRAVGERMLAALREREGAASLSRARLFLAHHALLFDPRPRDGAALALTPAQIDLGLDQLVRAVNLLAGRAITLPEAISLLGLDLSTYQLESVAALVAGGLPIATVERLAAIDRAEDLAGMTDARAAEAYASFALTLAPHYRALGLDVPIDTAMFTSLRGTRKEDLAVLAVCLMKHHGHAEPGRAEEAIARLDATLGLFRRSPAEASAMLAELAATTAGAGRAAHPDFAAWLDDDALLDRFVHLARLAGQEDALSRNLRSDFLRGAAIDRELAHLQARAERSPEQEARLRRLEAGEVERPGPAWTRRRLAERVDELLAAAYDERLGAVLRRLLQTTWGIAAPRLTPSWRDALRFFLAVEDNRALLGEVLRCAAAGVDPKRTLPKNRAWIAEAAPRFDVEAWLAPRRSVVEIAGEAHTLAIERDPIEVLRMGIPFGTCLSLDDGCNAASTVINAADAGKHVLYLRDARGNVVARKLIAVSDRRTLLGYRLYVAARERQGAITEAFASLCAEIAESARLRLADTGEPQRIHEGFWYDDGTVPFGAAADGDALAAYCRALGRPVPERPGDELLGEAEAFAAVERGDQVTARQAVDEGWWPGGPRARAAAWLAERLPRRELLRAAKDSPALAHAALAAAAREGVGPLVEAGLELGSWQATEVTELLTRFPRSEEVATALLAGLARRHRRDFDDHGLEHQTTHLLPQHAAAISVRAGLRLCDQVGPLWDWVAAGSEGRCQDCVETGERAMARAVALAYARERDPEAVIERLGAARSSRCARRAALHIAARYALAADAPAPALPPPRRQPLRACPEAVRALGLLRRRDPELEGDPELLAALLRQSAGALPFGVTLPTPREDPWAALGDLVDQLDLSAVLAPWPAAPAASTGGRLRPSPAALDAPMELIERHLAGEPVDRDALDRAYGALLDAGAPGATARSIVAERLSGREAIDPADHAFLARHLRAHGATLLAEAPDLVVRLARFEEARTAAAECLVAKDHELQPGFDAFRAAAARAEQGTLPDLFFDAWVRARLRQGWYGGLAQDGAPELLRRAARIALAEAPPETALRLYRGTKCHELAAVFLEELERSPALSTWAMRKAIGALSSWEDGGARLGWLTQALAARREADAQAAEAEASS